MGGRAAAEEGKGRAASSEMPGVAHSDGDVVYHSVVSLATAPIARASRRAHGVSPSPAGQVDAILGALTMPDIGQLFPDNDPRLKGAPRPIGVRAAQAAPSLRGEAAAPVRAHPAHGQPGGGALPAAGANSDIFMEEAYKRMTDRGYRLGNCDVTLICQKPRVNVDAVGGGLVKEKMVGNVASLLHTDVGLVNVKARTHEKVDSVGECRAIECHVVLTLERED